MPFTFSHPAIILPFKYFWSKRFSSTGLIIGSVTPDFEYFSRFRNWSAHSHTWSGILWFDLPVSLILCFIFHEVVKPPLFSNLPLFLSSRLQPFNRFNWKTYFPRRWPTVLFSLLLGIVSHLLWDRLTHQTYRFLETAPAPLQGSHTDFFPTPLYRVIQIAYSMFGLAVITFVILRFPVEKLTPSSAAKLPYWIMIGFITLSTIGTVIIFTGLEFVDWITMVLSSGLIGITAASFLMLPARASLLKGWR